MEHQEQKIKIESWGYINGLPVERIIKEQQLKWTSPSEDSVFQSISNNMGIGLINPAYIEVNEIQDKNDEYKKIKRFIKKYIEYYAMNHHMSPEDIQLDFINYGKTELVYVLTDKDGNKVTLLVKQPAVRLGEVQEEMKHLIDLKQRDQNVIAPIDYFQLGDQELYITPYIDHARCIASDETWGMYIPEPYYRFESFTKEQERIVNICMISKLVSLYDFEKQEGIACCKLGGGDFMLPKGWENENPTTENTLSQLLLIAARKKIKCSFEDYLQIIKDEFSRRTIMEDQSNLLINLRGRVPMNSSDIVEGIKLGKSLINTQRQQSLADENHSIRDFLNSMKMDKHPIKYVKTRQS